MVEYQLSVSSQRHRLATVDKNDVTDLDFENIPNDGSPLGGIYVGRVIEILHSIHSAFVEIGLPHLGLIPLKEGELPPLTQGALIMVQVTREAFRHDHKGVRLTRQITLSLGPLLYTPFVTGMSVSKQIKGIFDGAFIKCDLKPNEGLIIRHNVSNFDSDHLLHLLFFLRQEWKNIQEKEKKPSICLIPGKNLLEKTLRKMTPKDTLVIDHHSIYAEANQISSHYQLQSNIVLSRESAFSEAAENAWDSLFEKTIYLPQGGNLIIEETRGLTVIDVNSQGVHIPLINFNKIAIREVIKQIYLRDLSGAIVVDLAGHMKKMKAFIESLIVRSDTHILGVSALGLLELTRKKLRPSLPQRVIGIS